METEIVAGHDFVFEVARDLDIADTEQAARIADYIVGQVEYAGYGEKVNALRDLLDENPNRKSISVKALREILDDKS